MVVLLPLAVAIIGAVLYLLFNKPESVKAAELARLAYFAGLLVFLLQGAGQVVDFLNG